MIFEQKIMNSLRNRSNNNQATKVKIKTYRIS